MKIVDLHEAAADLCRLVQEALDGEDIVIARGNQLVVRLALVETARSERRLGWAKGQVTIADDFDAPLDDFARHR